MAPPIELPSASTRSPVHPSSGPGQRDPVDVLADRLAGWTVGLFVAAFAFLLASFPARNSDLWLHLAAGRELAEGKSSPWTPLAVSADPQVNHTWLYDLLTYGVYSAAGGTGLVVFKALLVAVLALVLLRVSRAGAERWIPTTCIVLAVLAMGTRLLLQPATVSYLLLALTLWVVWDRKVPGPPTNREEDNAIGPANWAALRVWLPPWPLMVLFVVWVNMDYWFVLGLGTVALVWLGQVLDGTGRGQPGESRIALGARRAAQLAILGLVCLLNPAHVYAFTLPPELQWFGSSAASAAQGAAAPVTSPWDYLVSRGYMPAAVAYFPLAVLGLFSFALNLPRWHWQRFLPWLGLGLVSVFQARAVPFFAVVAGPVLAWNLQEFLAWHPFLKPRSNPLRRTVVGTLRLATAVACLVLFVCAWPGWLQIKFPWNAPEWGEPRRWAIETPPSLERGAEATRRWHQQAGQGGEGRGLHLSRATAYAFAWFCPEEQGLVDDGLAAAILDNPQSPGQWEEEMRRAGINHLIVYAPERGRLFEVLGRLSADPERWPLLYLEGDLAVFGWRDARAGIIDPIDGRRPDLNQLAFHPAKDKRAPRARLDEEPELRLWTDAFWKPAPQRSIDLDEATLYLLYATANQRSAMKRHLMAWEGSQAAGLISAAGSWGGPVAFLDGRVRLALLRPLLPEPAMVGATTMGLLSSPRGQGPWLAASALLAASTQSSGVDTLPIVDRGAHVMRQAFFREQDTTPPALLYLAMRAARRALASNAEDAQAYLVLGETYWRLLHETRERVWSNQMPQLVDLRYAQASWAFNQAVRIKSDYTLAHFDLGRLYEEMNYLDLAVAHRRIHRDLTHKLGRRRGQSARDFREQEAQYDRELNQLAEKLASMEKRYAAEATGLRVYDQALAAFENGLAGKALQLLKDSDVAAFGRKGMALELELLLRTGQAKDVYDWTSVPEQKATQAADLGIEPYHWLRAQALAALGDYALAAEELAQLVRGAALTTMVSAKVSPLAVEQLAHLTMRGRSTKMPGLREVMSEVIAKEVLGEQPGRVLLPHVLWREALPGGFRSRVMAIARNLREEANARVIRGLLALEEGDADEAKTAFRLALALWKDEASAASGAGIDFRGRVVAQGCLAWLE